MSSDTEFRVNLLPCMCNKDQYSVVLFKTI